MTPNSELILSSYEISTKNCTEHYVQGKQDQTVNHAAGFLLFVFLNASVKLKVGEPSVSLPSPVNTVSESSKGSLPKAAWQVLSVSLSP